METTRLQVGTFTRSLLIELARNNGAFERAGLEVVETSVTSSPAQFSSLERGEFDVILTSPDNVLAYRFLTSNPLSRNLPVTILQAIDRGLGLSLWRAPSLTNDDLRDSTLAVDVPGSGFAFVAYALMARLGLEPGDYDVVALGSTPQRASALIEGACAATVLNAGNELRARGAGCVMLGTATELGPYLGTVVAALVTHDPTDVATRRRFSDVLRATSDEVLSGGLEREVVDGAMRLLGLDDEQAREHYACLLDPSTGLVADARVDPASVATLIELRRRYMASPELDTILASLGDVVAGDALA